MTGTRAVTGTKAVSGRLAAPVVLALFMAAVLVPFASLLLASLQPAGAPLTGFALPDGLHFENFSRAWSAAGFGTLLRSSLVIALCVVPAAVVCATLAGYALATLDVPGRGRLYAYLLLGLAIPTEGTIIPLYYDLRAVGLTNTVPGLAVAEIGAFMPFGVFWMRAHFATMPRRRPQVQDYRRAVTTELEGLTGLLDQCAPSSSGLLPGVRRVHPVRPSSRGASTRVSALVSVVATGRNSGAPLGTSHADALAARPSGPHRAPSGSRRAWHRRPSPAALARGA
jgi:hypothetical protein